MDICLSIKSTMVKFKSKKYKNIKLIFIQNFIKIYYKNIL